MVKSQGGFGVDMVVEMPKSMFQEKDHLNLRYFYKRAYYLATVAVAVRGLSDDLDISFTYLNDNPLLPIVAMSPKQTQANGNSLDGDTGPARDKHRTQSGFRIQILPVAAEGLFAARKLAAASNCIRPGAANDEKLALSPTPFYNATLRAESTFLVYLRVLRQAEKGCPAFKDACMLGRIWLQQRGLSGPISKGGFGHFEWAVLVALLLQTGGRKGVAALSTSLSSIQIFKAVVQFLATTDFRSKPCDLGLLDSGADSIREAGPVLYDAARQLNLAFKMSLWSAMLLHQHAKWTHDLLISGLPDQFSPTFITRADLPLQSYDLLVRIQCPSDDGTQSTRLDRRELVRDFSDGVFRVLSKALGDRVQLIHIQLPSGTSWDLSGSAPLSRSPTVLLGVVLDSSNMARQVDHGPAAEEKKEARRFRQFWGEKAELRRFKDGSILETLIWTQSSPFGLCEEIMRYILKLHLHLDHDDLEFIGQEFGLLLPPKSRGGDASFSAARQAFGLFEKDLRDIQEDLPLHILRVEPIAPELRSASVMPPTIGGPKAALSPMDVIISFEASGKWPDNLAAIQRAKIAFLLKLGSSLREAKSGISTTLVGLEDAQLEVENLAFLDIVYNDGAAFRLRIHSDLEEKLLERRIKDKELEKSVRTDGAHLLGTFKRLYTHLPLQNQAVSTNCTRFPALSASIRLMKHWFSCHKLTCHFTDEFVELAVLHVFLEPCPWQAPSSAMTGFLRTLFYIANWDWRTDPLVVDTSGELSAAERATINTRLEAWRKIDPNMNHTVLCVATSFDASGTAFTINDGQPAPSKVVATRMTTLARSACKAVRDQGIDLDPRALFRPSLTEYDVLIHLSPKVIKAVLVGDDGVKRSVFKNLDKHTGRALLPVPRHPATTLLAQLKVTYSGPMLFFQGGPEDSVIAAIWNPQVHRRSFRANLPSSFMPAAGDDEGDDDLVEVNRGGILAEIARIGGELIEKIEVVGLSK